MLRLTILILFVVMDSLKSAIFVSNNDGQINLAYDLPLILPERWIEPQNIQMQHPYNCFYVIHDKVAATTSHSCILSVTIPMDHLYNYGILYLVRSTSTDQISSSSSTKHTMIPASHYKNYADFLPFRLSVLIERDDHNLQTPVDIYVTFSIAKLFHHTLYFNETIITHHFQYDFHIPLPQNVADVFKHIENYRSITFSGSDSLELKINSFILQDHNIMPIQNYFWNGTTIRLKYSHLKIEYLQ
jgi:hypothetical protein